MVGKVVVNGDTCCHTFDFHAAFHVFKARQGRTRRFNRYAHMACSRNGSHRIHAVVFAHQSPIHMPYCLAFKHHIKYAFGCDIGHLPACSAAECFHRRPHALLQHAV